MNDAAVRLFAYNLERTFTKQLGASAMRSLRATQQLTPAIAVAGGQLTGKSTLARNLAKRLGVRMWSVGAAFRAEAASRNMSPAALAAALRERSVASVDVAIDARTCTELVHGGVIEGRQPAFMALFAREEGLLPLGAVSILVTCAARERAVRFLERECGEEAARAADEELPEGEPDWDLADFAPAVARLRVPDAARFAAAFAENARRDADDVARYRALYGIDYREPGAYDVRLDTSGRAPAANLERAVAALRALGPGLPPQLAAALGQ